MSVTKYGNENRKLHNEDNQQRVWTESRRYADALIHTRIAENNHVITNFQETDMMEKILQKDNLNKAYKKVKSNKGIGGVDKMSVYELLPYLNQNQTQLLHQLRNERYKPNPVHRVEIPKAEKGKVRELRIPTAIDRVIQQAIAQILTPIYEKQFSDSSYRFRPNRSQHDALKKYQEYVDEGFAYVVDMDLP